MLPFAPVLVRHAVGIGRHPPPLLPGAPASQARRRARTPSASDLTVFSVIRNGITNGYPFVEAYGSWLDVAQKILILDGESTDGTRETLDALAALDPRIHVVGRPWPATSRGGGAIADFTTAALRLARTNGGRLMYIQADEVYTPEQRAKVAAHREGAYEFAGCVNFWNSFDRVVANEFPMRYVRLFPAAAGVRSIGDGFSFEVADIPVEAGDDEILHYGWCFPVNILLKHVSHARLYRDDPAYVARGHLARILLEQRRYDRRLLDALAPAYRPIPFAGAHPRSMRHLLGLTAYDPAPGLELLGASPAW